MAAAKRRDGKLTYLMETINETGQDMFVRICREWFPADVIRRRQEKKK